MHPTSDEFDDMRLLSPVVRQAIMRQAPDYFALSPADRELMRARWAVDGSQTIRHHILIHGLGKSEAEAEAIVDGDLDLSDQELLSYNTLIQQARGVGVDYFSWNEFLAEDETALTWETIADYDRASHEFREKCALDDDEAYVVKPYRGRLHAEWARYLEDGEVRYGVLSTKAHFLTYELEDVASEMIEELVPSKYVPDKNHGRTDEAGMVEWNMKIDAGGYESLHSAMRKASTEIQSKHLKELQERFWADEKPAVWVINQLDLDETGDEEGRTIVFSGPKAMGMVRPRSFLADCAALAGNIDELRSQIDVEKEIFRKALQEEYDRLQPLHPKGITPFTRKKKLVMPDGLFEILG